MDRLGLAMFEVSVAVGATAGLAVRLTQLIVERIRGRGFSRRGGWPATLVWTLGSALAAFATAGAMSIGIFVLPFAVITYGVAAWRYRAFPEGATGTGLGAGIVMCVIGLMNPTPLCDATAIVQDHVSACAGVSGATWLPLAGLALIIMAASGQMMMMEREKAGEAGRATVVTN
jgi:hypothetical protein